ncbi:MAG: PP2C family protein-serine/threonine phosphatase, partial [Phycisphaerae bacterium]|nr:PP2C family protein-serine/threonine phosphatase [Phycisphaerae bacterium]
GLPSDLFSFNVTRGVPRGGGAAASLGAGPAPNPPAVDPAQVASRLNSLYPMESNGEHYFTMIYGLLDVHTRRLRFTVAGHPGPILAPAGGQPRRLDIFGLPIGMVDEAEYDESVIELQPGDRLYLHSDGLTEEVNAREEAFGDDRLLSAVAEAQVLNVNDAVESLVRKVVAWRGEDHLRDDVSILAIAVA